MGRSENDTTPADFLRGYEALVAAGAEGGSAVADAVQRMREAFERRTGAFRPEDPWFEARSRAFWDDALTTARFGLAAADALGDAARDLAARLARAHRGLFEREEGDHGTVLVDLWSGAELVVRPLDEAQALALAHADAPIDGRVAASGDGATLYLLPGAFHHPADAREPIAHVLDAARERGLGTGAALDALMRMEMTLRTSSRVKPAFAYRVESLPRA